MIVLGTRVRVRCRGERHDGQRGTVVEVYDLPGIPKAARVSFRGDYWTRTTYTLRELEEEPRRRKRRARR